MGEDRRLARAALLLAAVLAGLGCDGAAPRGRVVILGLDGVDPDAVAELVAEGELPAFARLQREGASGRLLSQQPMLSPVLWTTIATGRPPEDHGIGHFVATSASGEQVPVTSRLRRVRALWNIASAAGREVAVVGWWATWPPEEVRGAIVSDRTAYHFLFEEGLTGVADGGGRTWPPALYEEIQPLLRRPAEVSADELAAFARVAPAELAAPFRFEDEMGHLRWAIATASSYGDIGLELWRRRQPDLAMVYIEAPDTVSHLFGHLHRTSGLSGELARQQERYGAAVLEVYRLADRLVARYLAAMDENTTLLVVSDHGFALGTLHADPRRASDLRRVSADFHREEGIVFMAGRQVRAGARFERPSLLDVTPTVLALLGLPASRQMPGRVLAEGLTASKELARVDSWEDEGARPAAAIDGGGASDGALLEHLRALGYVEGGESSPEGERTMAALHFRAGRHAAAEQVYRRLLERSPDDPGLHTSLAGCLGAMGRLDEALPHLAIALRLDPLYAEAHHNLGVVHERLGDRQAAADDYRNALRCAPDYAPARAALAALAGEGGVGDPASSGQRRAAQLAQQASDAARRGAFAEAMALLDQAEALAPELAMVHHFRCNVAYLTGDREGAIVAMQRGLALEPDNVLFQENLRRLREEAAATASR